jgi:hypothetical protein
MPEPPPPGNRADRTAEATSAEGATPGEDTGRDDLNANLHRYDLERDLDEKIGIYRRQGRPGRFV